MRVFLNLALLYPDPDPGDQNGAHTVYKIGDFSSYLDLTSVVDPDPVRSGKFGGIQNMVWILIRKGLGSGS